MLTIIACHINYLIIVYMVNVGSWHISGVLRYNVYVCLVSSARALGVVEKLCRSYEFSAEGSRTGVDRHQ